MEEKYENYLNSFKSLDTNEKKEFIVSNLDELIELFKKINEKYDVFNSEFSVENNNDSEDDFLINVFIKLLSLKEISSETINILLDNFYERDNSD